MPEGHTIHRIARDHGPLLFGEALRITSPQGRFAADAARVDGQVLTDLEAVGKHLFYHFENGDIGHVHLGLFGKFRVAKGPKTPDVVGMVRMRMQSSRATIDLAGPTECSIGTLDDRAKILKRLGPDPLGNKADSQLAIDRMAKSKQAIGAVLLDQKVLCGVGNVYRAEALFVCGIHPSRLGLALSRAELQMLWDTVVAMLRKGVQDNRIITVGPEHLAQTKGRRFRRGEATFVYHRDRCLKCATPIQTVELAGRPCYFCPTCQQR
ncbi:MAG: DNA-formamidopyrimidine glycosylase family protein [Actinomycetota bacterium]